MPTMCEMDGEDPRYWHCDQEADYLLTPQEGVVPHTEAYCHDHGMAEIEATLLRDVPVLVVPLPQGG